MDTASIIAEIEAAVATQLEIAGGDPAAAAAGRALLASLAPVLRTAAMSLAEQAAEEVRAQLPGHGVDLVISDGEPMITIRADAPESTAFTGEDLAARLTVRLPSVLKAQLEEAAGDVGDSVNSYIIKALSSKAGREKVRRRVTETFET